MAEHLHLLCPAKQEEIAEGGVVGTVYDDMKTALHELGVEAAIDGAARVVMNIVYHGSLMAFMLNGIYGKGEADGIVVVIIEEGALYEGAGGVVGVALLHAYAADQSRRARRLYEAGYFAAPPGGAGGFEALDYVAEAFVHALLDMNDAMPMVGHAYLAKGFYEAAFGSLYGGGLLPFLMDDIACWGEKDGWIICAIRNASKTRLASRNHQRYVINSFLVVVVTWVVGSV